MSEASFASLGPTLLARKGGAKPAMRPQLAPLPGVEMPGSVGDEQLEDLGWNDMGSDDETEALESAVIVSIKPAAMQAATNTAANEDDSLVVSASPLAQRHPRGAGEAPILADAAMGDPQGAEIAEESAVKSSQAVKRKSSAAAEARADRARSFRARSDSGRRAAFTLRLDTDRHLKLRLAATMQGVSAQALVTEALDAMLSEIDDLDALAERFNPAKKPN